MTNKHLGRVAAAAALWALAACSPGATTKSGATEAAPDPLARGRYLVESVGMCGDCHTLRLPDGKLDTATHLHGTKIPFAPLNPQPWAAQSPAIAGLPAGYDAAQLAHLLETGERPDGSRPMPPMPEYRMTADDAAAVAAYLASLPKPPA